MSIMRVALSTTRCTRCVLCISLVQQLCIWAAYPNSCLQYKLYDENMSLLDLMFPFKHLSCISSIEDLSISSSSIQTSKLYINQKATLKTLLKSKGFRSLWSKIKSIKLSSKYYISYLEIIRFILPILLACHRQVLKVYSAVNRIYTVYIPFALIFVRTTHRPRYRALLKRAFECL